MVSAKSVAEIIVALGVTGPITVLILSTVGLLFFGIALWGILGFLSHWFPLLIFGGAGIIALIELPKYGWHFALLATGILVFSLVFGFVLWQGTLSGPQNTYSLMLSMMPNSSSPSSQAATSSPIALATLVVAIVVGLVTLVGSIVIIEEEEES